MWSSSKLGVKAAKLVGRITRARKYLQRAYRLFFSRSLGHACASAYVGEEAEGEGQQEEEEDDDVTHTCQFCGKYDPSFTDEKLDMHYWQNCPMLISCEECGQVRSRECEIRACGELHERNWIEESVFTR